MSKVAKLLGVKYAVIQGGMACVSDARLAAAVSEAGGLGVIAAGSAPAEVVRREIVLARGLTAKPFGVNIMMMSPHTEDVARVCLDEGVDVVLTGAGNPARFMEGFKARGIKVVPVVPSVAIAVKMEKAGAHAVVAEGMEAGGHIGKLTTMAMIPQVADAVGIPVIAAGGIADGRGAAAALMLGAQGVQIGTRFLTAHECGVADAYKQAVLDASDISTTVTGAITGHPVRVIRNEFSRMLEEYDFVSKEQKAEAASKLEELGAGALQRAVDGDVTGGSVMAGQIAGLVRKRRSAAEIVSEIVRECREAIAKAHGSGGGLCSE